MTLQVLLVEDDEGDLNQYLKDLPTVFDRHNIPATLHGCKDFEEAFSVVADPSRRFDLVISDTYRGDIRKGDAAAIDLVRRYRQVRFCPLVIISSGSKPEGLVESDFVLWAQKAKPNGIELAIESILQTGVPQISRKLHEELDRSAGSFLWNFMESRWGELRKEKLSQSLLERIIRRRASTQLSDIEHQDGEWLPISTRAAPEYYIYPKLRAEYLGLGDILRDKATCADFRVILTPHCHLVLRPPEPKPKADYVLTVKTVPAKNVLAAKIESIEGVEVTKRNKKLAQWARSPAKTERHPEGRHWYLPAFLDIPHLYCDFLQVESLSYEALFERFEPIASLVPPYAEAMQSCFAGFYASVGIPDVYPDSISSLLP